MKSGLALTPPLLAAIVDDNLVQVETLLDAKRQLAVQRIETAVLLQSKIFHWIYAGDTALHIAAAGHRERIVHALLAAGADPNAAANHRRSGPLHYAADGYITGPDWDPRRQVKTLQLLLTAGSEIQAPDKNGATALHRAVRTRCAAAVRCLLDAGAEATAKNKSGSTPFHLAVQNTGRGGSGTHAAIRAQHEIVVEFLARGVSPAIKDGRGKSVLDHVRSDRVRELFER